MSLRKRFFVNANLIVLALLIIMFISGCSSAIDVESSKHLELAIGLLNKGNVSNEDLRTIEYHLYKVDKSSSSYDEAKKIIPNIRARIDKLNNDKIEAELKAKQDAVQSELNRKQQGIKVSQQKRTSYAHQYVNDYDRIQVGATAKASGRTLHIYLKYDLDDFVVNVARRYFSLWESLGFNKVIVYDKYKHWSQEI